MTEPDETLEEFNRRVFAELSADLPSSIIIIPIQRTDNRLGVSLHSWGLEVDEVLGSMEIAKGNIIISMLTTSKGRIQ